MESPKQSLLHRVAPFLVLACFSIYTCYWLQDYFTDQIFTSVDLPGHIAITEALVEQLRKGRLFFYDPNWFSGWPVFEFYGFIPHLVTAIVSIGFEIVSSNSVVLATHFLLVVLAALFPFSIYMASQPLRLSANSQFDCKEADYATIHAFSAGVFSLWFLNLESDLLGVGFASIVHIGLFAQLFGWHLLLWILACVFSIWTSETSASGSVRCLAVLLAGLFLSHPLTAVYAYALCALWFVWVVGKRWKFLSAIALGIGLSGFWLLPLLRLQGSYTISRAEPAAGDLITTLVRYPIGEVLESLSITPVFPFFGLNLIHMLIPVCLLYVAFSTHVRRLSLILTSVGSVVVLHLLLSSAYTSAAVGAGLHYYRFSGYAIVALLPVFAVCPQLFLAPRRRVWMHFSLFLILCLGLVQTISLPARELGSPFKEQAHRKLELETNLQSYLQSYPRSGRRVFEYYKDYKKFGILTPHLVYSSLHRDSVETLNGLFIQSSLAYQFPMLALSSLGADVYNHSSFPESTNLRKDDALEILSDFGVSEVISSSDSLIASVGSDEDSVIGPYHVTTLEQEPKPSIYQVEKVLIGVQFSERKLPFKYLELYLYAHAELYSRFQLVQLREEDEVPDGVQALITDKHVSANVPVVAFKNPKPRPLSHYQRVFPFDKEKSRYEELEPILSDVFRRLGALSLQDVGLNPSTQSEELHFDQINQRIDLTDLQPNKWYVINYSYFPYWKVNSGWLYRASGERMLFRSSSESAQLHYSKWSYPCYRWGLALSLFSLLILLFFFRNPRKSVKES